MTDTDALSPLQRAYLVGRGDDIELGGVATHGYFEFRGPAIDAGRLQRALDRTIASDPGLRTVVDAAGVGQRQLDKVPSFPLQVHDMQEMSSAEVEAAIERSRSRQAALVRPADQWPLFGVTLFLLPDDTALVAVDLDGLVLDLASLRLVMAEVAARYREPVGSAAGQTMKHTVTPNLEGAEYQRAQAYWQDRLPQVAGPPRLLLQRDPASVAPVRFSSRHHLIALAEWERLHGAARNAGLTPSALAAGVLAETLHRATALSTFTLVVPISLRDRSVPDDQHASGPHSSFVPLTADWTAPTFPDRCRSLQRQMLRDALHGAGAGPDLIAALARRHHRPGRACLPIGFTSALGLPGSSVPGSQWRISYLASQTAGLYLDAQVTDTPQGLLVHWDTVDEVLGSDTADQLFEHHLGLWDELVESDALAELDSPVLDHTNSSGAAWDPLLAPQGPAETLISHAWGHALSSQPVGRLDDLLAAGATPGSAQRAVAWLTEWTGSPLCHPRDLLGVTTVAATVARLTTEQPRFAELAEAILTVAAQAGTPLPAFRPIPSTRSGTSHAYT